MYAFVLPRHAALRRFTIRGKGFTAHSELRAVAEAARLYEKGIAQGSLATLAGFRFRFPFTLAPGYHAKEKMLETEPVMGETELPENEFEDNDAAEIQPGASNLHAAGFGLRLLAAGGFIEIGSPSHPIRVITGNDDGPAQVLSARGKDLPNRDLVFDAERKTISPETIGGRSRDGKLHFVGIIPSSSCGEAPASGRRIVFLLDRSGPMQGAPIEQAKLAVSACLGALAPEDRFNMIGFDDRLESLCREPVPATAAHRQAAREFLRFIDARGGTEPPAAVNAAASAGAGDAIVMTDGQVMGTELILSVARAAGDPSALPWNRQRQPGSIPDAACARDGRPQPVCHATRARGPVRRGPVGFGWPPCGHRREDFRRSGFAGSPCRGFSLHAVRLLRGVRKHAPTADPVGRKDSKPAGKRYGSANRGNDAAAARAAPDYGTLSAATRPTLALKS